MKLKIVLHVESMRIRIYDVERSYCVIINFDQVKDNGDNWSVYLKEEFVAMIWKDENVELIGFETPW